MFALGGPVVYSQGVPTTIEDRLVVGDVSVVADLYRHHGPFIHTISQKLVGAAADRLTQQVFAEAWRDRTEFNPSLGTVRNWLVRRARRRVSKSSVEAEAAVDRLVVADSLRRMDPLRRQVLLAGIDTADIESLARELDQPVAGIRGHLRRGTDQLSSDLAESRPDGGDDGLAEIMAEGPPSIDMVTPPEVVWHAIAAELNLDTGAVTTDDFSRAADHAADEAATDDDHEVAESSAADSVDDVDQDDGSEPATGDGTAAKQDGPSPADTRAGTVPGQQHADKPVGRPSSEVGGSDAGRPRWIIPVAVAVALLTLAVLAGVVL